MTSGLCERVVLVGFMGAGKTTVGRSVATRLGWRFRDLDSEIEIEAGASVAEIFDRFGEERFREIEARVADRVLQASGVVIATGGGWASRSGSIEGLPLGTASVWLVVDLEEALRRASLDARARPLLQGVGGAPADATEVQKRFDERIERYSLARWAVDTEGRTVEDVTARVLEIVVEYESETGTE